MRYAQDEPSPVVNDTRTKYCILQKVQVQRFTSGRIDAMLVLVEVMPEVASDL